MCRTYPTVSRRGFSLVEILVAIAVIAILFSIIIPVVGNVRDSALRNETVSNLRSVGVAFGLYVNDNKGLFPIGYQAANPDQDRDFTNWREELAKKGYLGPPDHKVMPGDPQQYEFSVLGSPLQRRNNPQQPRWDYATFSGNYHVLNLNDQNQVSNETVRVHDFPNPAGTFLVSEGSTHGTKRFNALIYGSNSSTFPDFLEDETTSVLFLDGHVQNIPLNEWPDFSASASDKTARIFWHGQ